MRRRLSFMLLMACLLSSCCKPQMITSCPPFPPPSKAAIEKIQSLHDKDVDEWIVRLLKLKKQLEVTEQPNS